VTAITAPPAHPLARPQAQLLEAPTRHGYQHRLAPALARATLPLRSFDLAGGDVAQVDAPSIGWNRKGGSADVEQLVEGREVEDSEHRTLRSLQGVPNAFERGARP
jgi:hypothetical protein